MMAKSRWFVWAAGLMLIMASLGCGICPLFPRLEETPTPREEEEEEEELATPTRRPMPTSTPAPTLSSGMEWYTNPAMGLSLLYPGDWTFEDEGNGVIFTRGSIEAGPTEDALFVIFVGPFDEIGVVVGIEPGQSPREALEAMQESMCLGTECEVGEIEDLRLGGWPGVGVEIVWAEEGQSSNRAVVYLAVASGDDERGAIIIAGAPEDEYEDYRSTFRAMLDSIEFFTPEEVEPTERGEIRPGDTVEGSIPSNGVDVWYFDAQEGQNVSITMEAISSDLDPYLELYDEMDSLLISDDDSGEGLNAAIRAFRIPQDGRYYIHASAFRGQGDYALSLNFVEIEVHEIRYGETVDGILASGEQHEWEFEGRAGDIVTISLESGEFDCFLELRGPAGNRLITDDDSGEGFNSLIESFELPEDGAYRIVARAFGSGSGAYTLSLERE